MVALELQVVLKWLRIFFEIIKENLYISMKKKSIQSLTLVPDYQMDHSELQFPTVIIFYRVHSL